jgi:hypothetical protein
MASSPAPSIARVGTLTYAYDADGHIVSKGGTLYQPVAPGAVTSASYNANNQLTQWTTPGSDGKSGVRDIY